MPATSNAYSNSSTSSANGRISSGSGTAKSIRIALAVGIPLGMHLPYREVRALGLVQLGPSQGIREGISDRLPL